MTDVPKKPIHVWVMDESDDDTVHFVVAGPSPYPKSLMRTLFEAMVEAGEYVVDHDSSKKQPEEPSTINFGCVKPHQSMLEGFFTRDTGVPDS